LEAGSKQLACSAFAGVLRLQVQGHLVGSGRAGTDARGGLRVQAQASGVLLNNQS